MSSDLVFHVLTKHRNVTPDCSHNILATHPGMGQTQQHLRYQPSQTPSTEHRNIKREKVGKKAIFSYTALDGSVQITTRNLFTFQKTNTCLDHFLPLEFSQRLLCSRLSKLIIYSSSENILVSSEETAACFG